MVPVGLRARVGSGLKIFRGGLLRRKLKLILGMASSSIGIVVGPISLGRPSRNTNDDLTGEAEDGRTEIENSQSQLPNFTLSTPLRNPRYHPCRFISTMALNHTHAPSQTLTHRPQTSSPHRQRRHSTNLNRRLGIEKARSVKIPHQTIRVTPQFRRSPALRVLPSTPRRQLLD